MSLAYYEPMFYIASEKMPFNIRVEVTLKNSVDGEMLSRAVNKAVIRYPYFKIKVVERSGELVCEKNDLPVKVFSSKAIPPLFSAETDFLPVALSYTGNEINFYASHIMTDGSGFFPFIKSTLYEYLCAYTGKRLDDTGIRLADSPLFDDECSNPFPEEKIKDAEPFFIKKQNDFFRLRDGGHVTDDIKTVYRFCLDEAEVMHFNHDNDGSPCALISSLMARAVESVHPDNKKDIVSAVSFNLRPGLGNKNSYRMLCSSIDIPYPVRLLNEDVSKICTCSRGRVTLASQPENVLYYAKELRRMLDGVGAMAGIAEKKAFLGKKSLEDSVNNTFSVSYVGRVGLGCLEPYIESIYNITDGSTYKTVFIEVSSVNGKFNIAFLQGFSSDIYYRAFLHQLSLCGLSYTQEGTEPFYIPDVILP